MLRETELLHAKVRRYTSPEEVAFFDAARAKPPELPALSFAPMLLGPARQNFNDALYAAYVGRVVPSICAPGDDGQHGSAALCDITALQALSRRVHLGHFVAERKFRDAPARYRELVAADDVDGIMAELTNAAVEERIIERVARKVAALGAGGAAGAGPAAPTTATARSWSSRARSRDLPRAHHPAHEGRRGRVPHASHRRAPTAARGRVTRATGRVGRARAAKRAPGARRFRGSRRARRPGARAVERRSNSRARARG